MERGRVKWWNETKGYGFLTTAEDEDIFVHYSAIEMQGLKTLTEGQAVEFEVARGPKGPAASNVRPVAELDSPTGATPPSSVQPNRRKLAVFLCHSSSDKPAVRELFSRLAAVQYVSPWLDEKNLLPGQDWNLEITRAVRAADCVVVCLSKTAIDREGYVQKEIGFALDAAQEKAEGTIFLIPVRLEACTPPDRLARWHYVDLYDESGFEKLLLSLQYRATSLGYF